MADSLNPIDIEQSLADFDAAYPDAFVTKKENASHIGPLPMSAVHALRRHTAELGNAVDNFLRELVDKYTAIKHRVDTTDATPASAGEIATVPDGGTLLVEGTMWGKTATQDMVYVDFSYRYERDGASVTEAIDRSIVKYSSGGTLSTATAGPAAVGTIIYMFVIGEAATAIEWEGYTIKRGVSFA